MRSLLPESLRLQQFRHPPLRAGKSLRQSLSFHTSEFKTAQKDTRQDTPRVPVREGRHFRNPPLLFLPPKTADCRHQRGDSHQ